MGAGIDDRNFRGTIEQMHEVYEVIDEFDKDAGHIIQPDKTTIHEQGLAFV